MKIKEYKEGPNERRVLTGMIVDKPTLSQISTKWTDGLFSSQWSNIISGWCIEHFKRYGKPPGKEIETYFRRDQKKFDDATAEIIESYLSGLSEEYQRSDEVNSDYLVDLAGEHFNKVQASRLCEKLNEDLQKNDLGKFQGHIQTYNKIEMGRGAGIDLLQDKSEILSAFEHKQKESLIKYEGDLGDFFGKNLCREDFVSFLAMSKAGKSFWLMDMAWRAMKARHRVAFFSIGDLSKSQVITRFMTRAAEWPAKIYGKSIKWPTRIVFGNRNETANVEWESKSFEKSLDAQKAWKACERTLREIRANRSYFKLFCYENFSINVMGIRAEIERLCHQDQWVPDVICIDYCDLLAPPPGWKMEVRDQVNTTWKHLRGMSQKYHCLLLTATQANAASFSKTIIDRSNFSEDVRKLAHVTGMVGINFTNEEKERGLCRLNWIVLRDSEFSSRRCVVVASCLALANPAVISSYPKFGKKTLAKED